MVKRTIYIGNPALLRLKQQQMLIVDPETQETKGTVPIEDIAVLMLDHYQITLSHQVLLFLQENKAVVVSCDAQHMPLGIMLPLYGHTEHSERLKMQIEVSEPFKKQLWKQTIEQK